MTNQQHRTPGQTQPGQPQQPDEGGQQDPGQPQNPGRKQDNEEEE